MPAGGNFASYSRLSAAFSTLDLTRSHIANKGAWHLLPTTSAVLPTATNHFDRAGLSVKCCCLSFLQALPSLVLSLKSAQISGQGLPLMLVAFNEMYRTHVK